MIHINKKRYLSLITIVLFTIFTTLLLIPNNNDLVKTNKLTATVIKSDQEKITVQDKNDIIYTFSVEKATYEAGDKLILEYTGLLNKNKEQQVNKLVSIKPVSQDEEGLKTYPLDGLFSQFNILASNKLKEMSLDEKIGQLLLVKYPENDFEEAINKYKVGGFVFFEDDFENKSVKEVQQMLSNVQSHSKIPLLTAVDEEGGEIVRVSSNEQLAAEPFKSSNQLYNEGGFTLIKKDTINKSLLLEELGLNVNLAPVVDVSTSPSDFMYKRTIGYDTEITSEYAKTVIEANKKTGVSYVLKHFPGYANNPGTHEGQIIDNRKYEEIAKRDLPPFEAGINSAAEAILVSHITTTSIDKNNPASLSASVHNLLRNNLGFTGIIMTDNLETGATTNIKDAPLKALLAGNDIIMMTNYKEGFNIIKKAVIDGTISEEFIDNAVHRIIAWKFYKGLMYEKTK